MSTSTNTKSHFPSPAFPKSLAPTLLAAILALGCGGNSAVQTPAPVTPVTPTPAPTAISAYAGSPGGFGAVDGPAASARFQGSLGIAFDPRGNLLVAEFDNRAFRKVDPATGDTSTWAGLLGMGGLMDGYPADARCAGNWAMTFASDGTMYYTDLIINGIRRISPEGLMTTLIPGGTHSYSDGVGANVRFNMPMGIALDEARGCLYVADELNMVIRKVNLATTETTTMAGSYMAATTTDGSFETATFNYPRPIVKGADDVLYVGTDDSVRRVDLATHQVTTIAGNPGVLGYADGVGPQARFNGISGLALDGLGHLLITEGAYILDNCGNVLRSLDLASGMVTTLAGTGNDVPDSDGNFFNPGGWADGIGGKVRFNMPYGITVDGLGSAFITDSGNGVIRKVDLATGKVSTLAGVGPQKGWNDGPAAQAAFSMPAGIAVDAAGNAYVAEANNSVIRKISPQGVVSTLAGQHGVAGSDNGQGTAAAFNAPYDVALDSAGNLFVADFGNNCIRKITPNGTVSVFAGIPGGGGWTDGPGASALFSGPESLVMASDGNLYVADTWNSVIRKITPDGAVSTYAGSGNYALTDGIGTAADFAGPSGITEDSSGHLIVADTYNSAIRTIELATGSVSTLAGGTRGAKDGNGSEAFFDTPLRVLADPAGFLLVSDYYNNAIRKVTSSGVVTTVVGSLKDDQASLPGIEVGALPGQITQPMGLARNSDGSILVLSDSCVLKITGIK